MFQRVSSNGKTLIDMERLRQNIDEFNVRVYAWIVWSESNNTNTVTKVYLLHEGYLNRNLLGVALIDAYLVNPYQMFLTQSA